MRDLSTQRLEPEFRRKVLLVEDDASVVSSLGLFLRSDYEIHSAETVGAGVRLFQTVHPDVVVLDLRLSDGDGLDVLRRIRHEDPLTPVIVLTGYASMNTVEESLRLGASDYLHKPFDGYKLKSRIDQLTVPKKKHQGENENHESVTVPVSRFVEMQRKAKALSIFLHDSANPVTTALNAAEYLCHSIESNPDQYPADTHEIAELLAGSMGFISGLFEQSYSIERLTQLEKSEVAVRKIVELAEKLVRDEARKFQVSTTIHLQHPEATVYANRFAVARVLFNLLKNAIAAVKPQTGLVALTVDVVEGHAVFSVLDNGPGISSKLVARIFDEHFTTKKNGSGLGLYICKSLINSMNGTISVQNVPGQGCCFTIRIPCGL